MIQIDKERNYGIYDWYSKNLPQIMENQKFIGLEIIDDPTKMIYKFLSLSFFFIGSLILRNGLIEAYEEQKEPESPLKTSIRGGSRQKDGTPNATPRASLVPS